MFLEFEKFIMLSTTNDLLIDSSQIRELGKSEVADFGDV